MNLIIYFVRVLRGDDIGITFIQKETEDNPDFNQIYYDTSNQILNIPAEKIRHHGGQAYNYAQHHFMQYYKGGVEPLIHFYNVHQPKTIYEKHFINKINGGQFSLPWSDIKNKNISGEHGLGPEHGHSAFGPISEAKLQLEVERLNYCLKSIKKRGYEVENSYSREINGFPRGYFLLSNKGQWIFKLVGAKHRVAALVHLGWEIIPVNLEPNFPRCIYESQISNWPGVLSGDYTVEHAKIIFNSYFRKSDLKLWQ